MSGMPGRKIAGETDCHPILHALCQLMRAKFQLEMHRQGGRSDLEVAFPSPVCVFEFKYNQSVEGAVEAALDQSRATTDGGTSPPDGAWWPLA